MQEMEELSDSLNHVRGFMYEKDVTYMDFLNRVRTGELNLKSKGQWDVPHPWLNLFVPKTQISNSREIVVYTFLSKIDITKKGIFTKW